MKEIDFYQTGYHFSSEKTLMQWKRIHQWLSTKSYWSHDIPFHFVKTAGENSFCVGVFLNGLQIGYARLVTDYATFGYLADVYIEEAHRGKGLSKILVQHIMQLDWVNYLRRVMLATRDAHSLYERFGFATPQIPDRLMEINKPNIYKTHHGNNIDQ
jgi:GNAT superfamily N-acetyltransferase